MASKPRVELNKAGVKALLRSPEMQRDLRRRAEAIASAAGPGHEVDVEVTGTRTRATVVTATHEARRGEAVDRSLTRAIDAGRS
jgi:DUF1365 family protein